MAATTNLADNAPSTLPQVLHLSYKNRGQLHLDLLKASKHLPNGDQADDGSTETQMSQAALNALDDFGEALDKDDVDLDLWRRSARVSQALGSRRIMRYCLEAALEGEDEDMDNILAIPNVELNIVGHELRKVGQAVYASCLALTRDSSKRISRTICRKLNKHLSAVPQTCTQSFS